MVAGPQQWVLVASRTAGISISKAACWADAEAGVTEDAFTIRKTG
jgi:hypothetical protein